MFHNLTSTTWQYLKYKQRISLLSKNARLKYIKLTLQPNQANCDERLTALLIFDNALQSNEEWEATIRMLSLDSADAAEKASKAFDDFAGGVSDAAKLMDGAVAARAEKIRERQRMREERSKKKREALLRFLWPFGRKS